MENQLRKDRFGNFDFGLSRKEEARAARIHNESIIIDMVFWGPCTYQSFTQQMEKELFEFWETCRDPSKTVFLGTYQPQRLAIQESFPEFKTCWDVSGVTAGSRWVEGFASIEDLAFTFGLNTAMFDQLPWVIKALRADDIHRAKAEKKHAAWLHAQLSGNINANFLDLIEPSYHLGLRMIQLTYNFMTFIGGGCTERTDAGLSNYGAKVVRRMNELGIIVDTGHCGRQTTLDACALSTAPVIASHTSAEGVYRHARAKSDEEIRAIAASGGVVGVYCMPFCLASGQGVTIESMLDHIDYISNLIGWEHVGIGTDWPMPMPKQILREVLSIRLSNIGFRKEDHLDPVTNLIGFDDYRDFPNITRGLVKRGYRDDQIKGILGENILRVFKEVWG